MMQQLQGAVKHIVTTTLAGHVTEAMHLPKSTSHQYKVMLMDGTCKPQSS